MKISREKICMYTPVYSARASAFEIIERAVAHEVGGVEFMNFCEELSTPDREMAKKLGKTARAHGLKIPCFSAAADIYADPAPMVEMLSRYIEICSELEIPYLHHTIALGLDGYSLTEEEREARFSACVEHVLYLCDYAAARGVRTIIEDQGFVFNGQRNCMRLCALSGEKLGIVADTGNIMFFDEKPEDFIRAAGSRICHAHIKDYLVSSRPFEGECYQTRLSNYVKDCEVGTGAIDFAAVKQAFVDVGYDGMYAMEFATVRDAAEVERVLDFLDS